MLDSTTVRVVSMLENPHTAAPTADTSFLSREATAPARRLHRSMTGYAPTPLVELSGLAKRGGVRSVLVKDESPRFGLNAFKALDCTLCSGWCAGSWGWITAPPPWIR
mgnify:CR=1 FL=1